jgi:Flp pilus assembly protein TadD
MPQHAATVYTPSNASFPCSAEAIPATLAFALEAHRAGRLSEAEALYCEALAARPDHPNTLHYYGVLQHQRGHHTLALEYIDLSLELDPRNAECWNDRGFVAAALGEHELALRCYRVAVDLDPHSADAHNNLGVALEGEGLLKQAVYHYRQALQIDPTLADVHLNLGSALDRLMQFDDADVHYRSVLSLNARTANICLKLNEDRVVPIDVLELAGRLRRVHSDAYVNGQAA